MKIRVRSRLITALLATGMALPLCLPAATDSLHKAIHLGSNATVAGKPLQAGDYDLVVSGNQAKFESKGKVVADHDVVLTSGEAVTEITFQGKTQAIDF